MNNYHPPIPVPQSVRTRQREPLATVVLRGGIIIAILAYSLGMGALVVLRSNSWPPA